MQISKLIKVTWPVIIILSLTLSGCVIDQLPPQPVPEVEQEEIIGDE